jgi:hypothetical protein
VTVLPVLGLAALLLVNRVVLPRVVHRDVPFRALLVVNAAALGWVLAHGLPGTGGHGPTRWVVSALLVYHLARFFLVRAQARAEARDRARDAEMLASMRAARDGWDGAPSPDGGAPADVAGSSTP